MPLIARIGIFVASLVWLVKSADYFTEYSEKLGLIFGMSSFIIWATIIALGTSLPELISGIYAITWWWLTEYVIDGAVWSNIANILLVFWLWAIAAKTLKVNAELIDVDLPFFFISMAMFLFLAQDGSITRQESIFLLAFIVIFILYSVNSGSSDWAEQLPEASEENLNTDPNLAKTSANITKYWLIILASMAVLAVSAKFFIDSILEISTALGIASSLLTLSVVAFWTSLPEVLTSMVAIKSGKHGIALWNVFWSNTFNLTLVTWIPAFFWTLDVSVFTMQYGFVFLIIATLAAIFMTQDDKVQSREWYSLLLLYILFICRLTWLV